MTFESIQALFKSHQIKNTKQRMLVYTLFLEGSQPLTAEQVYFELKNKREDINLSTVYRILELFLSKDLLIKSYLIDDNRSTYEINHQEHRHHLVCTLCKKVVPIVGCPLMAYETYLKQTLHYDITGHKLEIFGICPDCKKIKFY